eukprot:4827292-Pyramimonas_sp.AAC.1
MPAALENSASSWVFSWAAAGPPPADPEGALPGGREERRTREPADPEGAMRGQDKTENEG